ncbi:MAG: hypothetical protein OEZ16_09295 [Chromatiales bacterium]|nr:hypothetical protein [Chromatiales bacterium]
MTQDRYHSPYQPPRAEIAENTLVKPGGIGLSTGVAVSLLIALSLAIPAVITRPENIDKVALLLALSVAPQAVIVASAWWWAVHGQGIGLLRPLIACAVQALLLTLSLIGAVQLLFWIIENSELSFTARDVEPTVITYAISLLISTLLGLVVKFRLHRAQQRRIWS